MHHKDVGDAERFIGKWRGVAASELSTSQSFLIELCELPGVERPHATAEQDYMFERPLSFHHADGSKSTGRVDLYKRGAFVLKGKGGRVNFAPIQLVSLEGLSRNFTLTPFLARRHSPLPFQRLPESPHRLGWPR